MKEEIKLGEWVRTKEGTVATIKDVDFDIEIDTNKYIHWICDNGNLYCIHEDIIKHSPNIKKIISIGDIIKWDFKNGTYYGVNEVINRFGEIGVYPEEYDDIIPLKRKDLKIKSILTREQFETNSYKVKE